MEEQMADCLPMPGYPPGMAGQPMGMTNERGPSRERRDPERNRHLFTLAESIAAMVGSQTRRGPERCKLRQMVEMLLDD